MSVLIGIDYSMTSPGVTVFSGDMANPMIADFTFHFITSKKRLIGKFLKGKIIGHDYPEWKTPEERFDLLSEWAVSVIPGAVEKVILEGYAFGAKGSALFQIGENTGVLKNKLYHESIKIKTVAPTSVKKHATGSGRASKDDMYDAFYESTGINLCSVLDVTKKDSNPVSDIVDSYFICLSAF